MTFFVLGSHPSLSIAEISAILGINALKSPHSKEVLLLDEIDSSPEALQGRLGGTIKIGDIVGEVKTIVKDEIVDLLVSVLSPAVASLRPKATAGKAGLWRARPTLPRPIRPSPLTLPHRGGEGGRISFGISIYLLDANRDLSIEVRQIGMAVKNKLKEDGRPARFVSAKTAALPSVAVTGEKLLESGGEFVFITSREKIYIGQTRTVQDFQAWSTRDYGRPRRDAKSGMLPPKLARMMINLATSPLTPPREGGGILDPFCGSGTVLMEAALIGFKNIIGGDISEKAIRDTKINLEWLSQNEDIDTSSIHLFNEPIETLTNKLKEKVDAVVGETYLGPPLSGRETSVRRKQIMDELAEQTASVLATIPHLLKDNGTAILALPAFQNEKIVQCLPTKKLAEAVGLKIIPFTGESDEISPSGGLLYAREGQRVGREIIKIQPSPLTLPRRGDEGGRKK